MKILVIIPAYNESENIEKFVNQLEEKINKDIDYLIINDCSTDNTKEILIKNNYNFIDLPINLGIGGAVQTGYMFAKEYDYDIEIQMDGDGQHKPEYLYDLIAKIEDGSADIVIGSRFVNDNNYGFQSTFLRRIGIKYLSNLIMFYTKQRIYDVTSGFRAVNKKYIEFYSHTYAQDYPEPEGLENIIKKSIEKGVKEKIESLNEIIER